MTKKIRKAIILACSSLFALSVSAFVGVNVNASAEGESAGTLIGATVRLTEPTTGIRFQTVLTESEYNATKNYTVTKYGTLVIPTDRLSGELTVENKVAENVVCVPFTEDGVYKFNAVIYDIPAWGYGTELTARSYVAYGDSEDALTYVYTTAEERSVLYVAQQALLDEEEAYTASQIGIVDDFNTNAYVYDYSNSVFATTYMALGQATASITDGVLNVTATAENDGVLIPFGSLDVSAMNSVVVKMTSGTSVTVKANATTLGTYNASSEGVDLTTALKASDVTSLSALQFIAAGEDTISISGVTIKSARDINLLYNMDDYTGYSQAGVTEVGNADHVNAWLAGEKGVNSRQSLRVQYDALADGSGISFALPEENTDFTGTDGIRFWLKFDGFYGNMEVRIGNGEAYNTASMKLHKNAGDYVTIPFSAFSGTVTLDEINTIAFVLGNNELSKTSYIDFCDISIGTADCYSVDNRFDFAKPVIGVLDTFDGSENTSKWTLTGAGGLSIKEISSSGEIGLQVYHATFGTSTYTLSATGYDLGGYDFNTINGFRMKFLMTTFNGVNSVSGAIASFKVTIGSEGNFYELTKTFYGSGSNNATYMVCDFAGMSLAEGSSGELNRSKIDTLKITCTGLNSSITAIQHVFDDMEFYTEKVGAQGTVTPTKWTTGDWSNATIDASTGVLSSTVTSANAANLQLKDTSYTNMQYAYAVRFTLKTTNVQKISVRLLDASANGIQTEIKPTEDGTYEYVLYFNQMTQRNSTANISMKFYYYVFYVTFNTSDGGTVEISDYQLLIG